MTVLAIDPGSEFSACLIYDGEMPRHAEKLPNEAAMGLLGRIVGNLLVDYIVIEQVASYGMPVGREVFDTVFWSGRFYERASELYVPTMLPRKDVKLHLCQSPRANDATIRQALIDRFGGKDKAIGKKSSPGPLWGLRADMWQALALAVTFWDTSRSASAGGV
jgi:hypothetical protein